MDYLIVSNNLRVKDNYMDVLFIDGGFEDVLIKVRDFVHSGYELVSHPLGASIRMLYSPYRSILISDKKENLNPIYLETIENSIENYRKHMQLRKPDITNSNDYSIIDSELLESAIKEFYRNSETMIN